VTSRPIDAGLIIGYISILGYYSSYNYIKGFNSFYNLPEIFYDPVSINSVLLTLTGISAFLFYYFAVNNFLNYFYPNSNNPVAEATRRIFGLIIFCLALILYVPKRENIYIFLIVIGFTLFFTYIFPMLVHPKIKGYSNKVKEQLDTSGFSLIDSITEAFKEKSSRFYLLLILILLLSGALSAVLGMMNAVKKEEYIIIERGTSQYIVMKHEGGKILVAPYNKKKNELIPEYKFLPEEDFIFKEIKIQSLKVVGKN
jgi:hypothetical protein